ncbi:hypothetical protein [Pseudonocardia humida]|uniref:Uncharacterized protein n=1 Tax=Pseudonocardia humida TaxID=2800819 RepID=A0ABT1A8W6_9PSEU|nr:hypothetical protein [Pseudonocardia humida]MCO1659438.1 hypothetical protein [Pseudonocardia humida]
MLLGAAFVQVTGAEDGAAHLVAFRLYEAGLMSGAGRYAAMCGKAVLAASMATAPVRRCPLCRASLSEPES